MDSRAVFVLWQSLVVGAYRSFFALLASDGDCRVGLAAPAAFREAGNQSIPCEPFTRPFGSKPAAQAFVLKCWVLHVQAVYFRGLGRAMRRFFAAARGRRMVVCIAEPYSLTAFLAWTAARMTLGADLAFYTYAAQNIYKRYPWMLRRIQAFLFQRSTAILVVQAEQEAVLRRHGYRGPTIPFPLWFDASRFYLEPRPAAAELTIGFAGSLTAAKGILDLLRACLDEPTLQSAAFALRIAGTGPLSTTVTNACETLRARGIDALYVGPQPVDRMPAFYRSLDLLVVPSRTTPTWKEQFGRVIIEAMACGVVVIGSDSGAIPAVIEAPERIHKEGNSADLAQVMRAQLTLLADPGARQKARAAVAARAVHCYADRVLAQQFAAHLWPPASVAGPA